MLLCFRKSDQTPAGLTCFSPRVIVLNILSVFTFWDLLCSARRNFFIVCLMWSHSRKRSIIGRTWFWERNIVLARSASVPHSIFKVAHCLNPYQGFLRLIVWITVVDHLERTALALPPGFADNSQNKTKPHISNPCSLSTVHRYIFIKKKKKKTVYETMRREH